MGYKMRKFKDREELEKATSKIDIKTDAGKEFLDKYMGAARRSRKPHLKKFLAFREMDCSDLLEEELEDLEKPKKDRDYPAEHAITEFKEHMKELGYDMPTIRKMISTISTFYKSHGYPLNSAVETQVIFSTEGIA